ncbi:cytochrome P450 [Lipomyces kononenkoae]|uniref:Cytochrome P450 n=1 Tax=Lipomyces kononenkoae TaxID=34357 RepID=A0ACC3T0C8_LIPKO
MFSLLRAIVGYTVPPTFLIVLLWVAGKLFQRSITPSDVPWLFRKKGVLAQGLERLLAIDSTRSMHDGYTKYAKNEQPFILPSALEGDQVLIPKEYVGSILHRKEGDVSFKAHLDELFQIKYTSLPYLYEIYDIVVKLISKDMTKLLENRLVAEALSKEARACLIELWGEDTENWIEMPLNSTLEKMTGRLINLLAVGPENCKNEALLEDVISCSNTVVIGSTIIKLFPNFLRPPIIELKMAEHLRTIDPASNQSEKPESIGTFLDIMIDNTFKAKAKTVLGRRPEDLAYSMFMMTFPGVHSSGVSGSSCILDLLSCPPEHEVLEVLREEVQEISSRCQGTWTAEDLRDAQLLDSAIKEGLRLNGLNAIAPARMVSNPDGTTLPNGVHLPYGTHIGIPQWAIHRDDDIYPNPEQYNPWRFSSDNNSAEWKRQNDMTTVSETYLAFGYGRRTCAGRYIFAHIFKLLMAEILLNYDIKPIGSRPKVERWGGFQVPSSTFTVTSETATNSRCFHFFATDGRIARTCHVPCGGSILLLYLMLIRSLIQRKCFRDGTRVNHAFAWL